MHTLTTNLKSPHFHAACTRNSLQHFVAVAQGCILTFGLAQSAWSAFFKLSSVCIFISSSKLSVYLYGAANAEVSHFRHNQMSRSEGFGTVLKLCGPTRSTSCFPSILQYKSPSLPRTPANTQK